MRTELVGVHGLFTALKPLGRSAFQALSVVFQPRAAPRGLVAALGRSGLEFGGRPSQCGPYREPELELFSVFSNAFVFSYVAGLLSRERSRPSFCCRKPNFARLPAPVRGRIAFFSFYNFSLFSF